MEINDYFTLIKQSKQGFQEYENILDEINKLKIRAKKNTILLENC